MTSPYRRSRIDRLFQELSRRFASAWNAIVDVLHKWTIGSSIFRRTDRAIGDAQRKLMGGLDTASSAATQAIRRRTEPGKTTSWKLLVFFDELRLKITLIARRIFSPFLKLFHRLSASVEAISAKIANDSRLRVLFAPIKWVFKAVATVFDFLVAYLGTRDYRSLLFGIPAILMFVVFAVCLIRIPLHSAHAKAQRYQRAAIEAMNNDQRAAAELYYRKLTQLGVDRPSAVFNEAVMLAETGKIDEAYEKMKSIGPAGETGYAGAHFWIAKSVYAREIEVDNPKRLELAKTHLLHTLKQYPNHPVASQLLAKVYRELGQTADSDELLDQLPEQRFSASEQVRLANTYLRWGNREKAKELANTAISDFSKRFANQERISAKDWLMWCLAETILDRPSIAMQIMRDAYERVEDEDSRKTLDENAPQMIVQLLDQTWLKGRRQQWLEMAREATGIEVLLDEIVPYLITRVIEDQTLAKEVNELIAPCRSSPVLSVRSLGMTGDLAMAAGDFPAARQVYTDVLTADASSRRILNNLAWIHGNIEPVDLKMALDYANQAVEIDPKNPSTRETRGQLLMATEAWKLAAEDLEYALNGLPSYHRLHQDLARCYEAMGDTEAAQSHRESFAARQRDSQ